LNNNKENALEYQEFLKNKQPVPTFSGVKVEPIDINPMLFEFQKKIVIWGLELGRFACFADCGLGKTPMQLEWAWHIHARTGGDVLIVAPLAVAQQTAREGVKFGRPVTVCRTQEDVKSGINITNYEMLEHFDAIKFVGVVLDESSILKSYTGTTKRKILDMFEVTKFKSAWTATPSPNDYLELGNHAEFLNVMPSNEMIMRWFVNDSMTAGGYRLKNHGQSDFWEWVCTWAVSMTSPADLGYPNDGYDLKPFSVHRHIVDATTSFTGALFNMGSLSATRMHDVKRASNEFRASRVKEIIDGIGDEPVLIWCDTDYEADALRDAIPCAVDVRGSHSVESKTNNLMAFSTGETQILITKPKIAGFGMNWQHCRNVIFMGLSYSYESYYQSLRRCWRFGQENEVRVHIVLSEEEEELYRAITKKAQQHRDMQVHMTSAMHNHALSTKDKRRRLTVTPRIERTENYTLILDDCCNAITTIETESIGHSIFSPPFANLYIYSDSEADMGNCADMQEFLEHFRFLVRDLKRATMSGRTAGVHCKDLPLYFNRDGAAGLVDFPGLIIRLFQEEGWIFHSRTTIWKDPVIEMQRTKNHGLLYKNVLQNSCVSRMGMADYMLWFKKWDGVEGTLTANPVSHKRSDFDLERWQKWASPVWFDINQTKVLNYQIAKENGDEKHICPLQLDVIERSIELYSNKGDLIFSPFAGIGSEGYMALHMGRKFTGIELKPSYYDIAKRNLDSAVVKASQSDMSELLF